MTMAHKVQIDNVVRDATAEEAAAIDAAQANATAQQQAAADVVIARANALAKLATLGLTENEIAALLP